MFCFATLADAIMGTMYTDITGAFPVRSFKSMQYVFVAYIYSLNAIIIQAMPSRTNASMEQALTMWNFTSLRLPFSEYSAILAKSPPNKIPKKFHLLRKFPQNSICSGLGLDSELTRNPAMCLVHN